MSRKKQFMIFAVASGKGETGKTTVAETLAQYRSGKLSEAKTADVEGHWA